MVFRLTGRDELSDVFDDIGDAGRRMARRLLVASIESDAAVRRFTNNTNRRLAGLRRDSEAGGKALGELRKATMLLAPAAIPAAASLAPIAAGAGAVAVALGVMGAALGPQIARLGEASEANKAWQDAVDKSGASSKEAVTAQQEYLRLMAAMPPETQRAAVAVGLLKDEYKDWSDDLSKDTMAPFIKGVAIANSLLPKTRGLVKGTAAETDRFMTIIGGEMASPGLDRLSGKFEKFSTGVLSRMNDKLIRLLRTTDSGQVGGNVTKFMTWASAQGPRVADVLSSVGTALMNVLEAGSDVGVGLLDVIGVLAHLVSAVPPSAISTFLQLALVLKLVKAAALGMAAARTALAGFAIQLVAMQTASAAAPGRLAAVTASIGALSRGAKVALAGTGIGLLVLALGSLSSMGKKAPPDVDRLTTSLGKFAQTGKVGGEASKAFGKDLGGLADSLRTLSRPGSLDQAQQFLTSLVGMDSTPVEKAKKDLDAVDKALAGLVQSGRADLASAAFDRVAASMRKQGMTTGELNAQLGDYKAALADQAFEAELAAQAQGLFGAQAQKTQAALAAQRASADGLRQSIVALNDVQRAGLGGMIGFEASIDAAAKAAQDNAGVLNMQGGKLDLAGEKSRAAATALNDLAAKTDEATASARDSGASWETVNGIYTKGRAALIRSAQAMGLTKAEAASLANQILKTPDKTAKLKGNLEDLEAKLKSAKGKLSSVPDSRRAKVRAEISDLEAKIREARRQLDNVDGKTATTYVVTRFETKGTGSKVAPAHRDYATGGPIGFPGGGPIKGPGTGTSDSIPINASDGEYMINARSTAKYLPLIEAINADKLGSGYGMGGAGGAVAQGLAAGMAGSTGLVNAGARQMASAVTAGIREELEIRSPSKKTAALAKDAGRGLIVGLTGSRDKIRSTAADLAKDIRTAFEGRKESGLVRMVTAQTNRLMTLAARRDKIAAKIAEAKGYAGEVTTNARSGAQLSNLGLEVVTGGTIKSAMGAKLSKIRRFTAYIKKLAARGLHKTLLRQILDMGPEQGYAYAAALADADKATLSSVNKVQYGLDTATRGLGEIGADRLYDSGKNAGKGFLAGLESQQKDIEKLMLKIAKAMQLALRKALGIASPAKKMIPDGINTARGVAVGVLRGLPHIDSAMQAVAGRMSGRAVAMRPAIGRQAVAAGGGAGSVEIHVHVDGAVLDPVAVGRQIQTVLLEFKRARGGAALGLA
jgi:chorismate mutase